MHLVCLSLHHIKTSYDNFLKAGALAPAEFYRLSKGIQERILLQTGTRVEVYALIDEGVDSLLDILSSKSSLEKDSFKIYFDRDAVVHLFRLVGGIESRVLGETYLLRQVEDAFHLAKKKSAVGSYMDSLFNSAIRTGRKVRLETKIEGSIPVADMAVKNILDELPTLEGKIAVLLGAGLTGRKAAKALVKRKLKLIVVNRNYDIGKRTAREIGAKAVKYAQLSKTLSNADVLICATLASHYRITAELIKSLHRKSPLVIVDVSPFGNVDLAVAALPNIVLKNGELRKAVEENMRLEKAEVPKVERIIEEEIEKLDIV
ncbi:MAG: NAD(P)-binding domain-containing protein [Methanobacteriota archaeon]